MAKRYTAKEFSRVLRDLAKVPARVSRDYSERLRQELDQQFSKGVDPYGTPWKALAPATLAKGRHPPPLTDSGHMSRNITVLPMQGAGVRLVSSVGYSRYHQEGTTHIPVRRFFPVSKLPAKWLRILNELIQKDLNKTVG
jgi:hypothetical protein